MNNNQQQPNASQTNAKKVRKQNAAASQNQSQQTEFASETDAQEVRKQNQQSEQKKTQNQNQQQQ
ncbi:small acid-soluble spore protein E (minor gamma-type SASP) [Salibacterium salarium]|uniref:gamma-type small acid-soluble spore protein n=1 Tax=Salibacterium salarium TaxID=284579 RepID=UPI002784D057|nr:gamma-type small acid-soluble spore protein [Salibacterium salarium]MDQ0300840.1 small acid-soluble spore protein E (minor gamma-type SASP) [Salibacterium salarium]